MKALLAKAKAATTRLTVSKKIMVICAISSLATLIALCSISFIRDWQAFKKRKLSELETFAHILESNSVASLRFNDPYAAREYVDSLNREPDIRSVSLYDAEDELFARYARSDDIPPRPAPDFEGHQWGDGSLLYATSVELDRRHLGKILIESSTKSYQAAIKESLTSAIALLIGGLAIALILASRLQGLITRPIQELVEVTRIVTDQQDFSQRVHKRYDDEIGSLVDSFNGMLEAISERDAALLDVNSNLEKTVEERTSDLRKRNAALKKAMDAAKAASVAKSEFLAMTSHELRTPLNPIIGYVEMLLREKPDSDASKKLILIQRSAQHLLRLIDDILDFNRIERGSIKLQDTDVDVRELCSEVVCMLQPRAHSKGLELSYRHQSAQKFDFDTKLIRCDRDRLRQILLNLIDNALKFTSVGSVQLRSQFLANEDGQPTLRIEVEDTGIGIAENDKGKLFKPFSQIDGSWTREYGGMGLGLAISSKTVAAMNGVMGFRSEKGVGSRFHVELPVRTASDQAVSCEATETTAPPFRNGKVLTLVVEDEPVNRELIDALLSSLGHEVICAVDGVDALEKGLDQPIDLVLMDISMPRLDGFATAREFRSRHRHNPSLPIVAMTAHVTPEDRQRCFDVGMNDYISKPISYTKLKAILAKWLKPAPDANTPN